ncbi:acetyl-CoA acyltransferase B, putative [Eimeria acervulina]|uniref:acetyl-CoA C-acyltransferase n=1 Tax=Eimeria acervulina TaxID=5801 RepID=U6GGJ2_EIMAC|nr:acetyl-CoA acyltransferase B, putative [Eimeria acervulina]CDI77704.1 acetyl-CoA acyltransferase B, putative [Eimeria acervulina]
MHRLQAISTHVSQALTGSNSGAPDDVVICCAIRTPLTKAKRGGPSSFGLKDEYPETLLCTLFEALLTRTKIKPSLIEDVCIGNVLQPGAGALGARIAALLGGLPLSTSVHTVNRQCSSGLQAVAAIAGSIAAGNIDIGVAGGVESMTHFEMTSALNPEKVADKVFEDEIARNCLLPMGTTSDILARRFGVSREEQDAFAVESHSKAWAAQTAGRFNEEIVPVTVKKKDANGNEITVAIEKDDGIREGTTMAALQRLKPAFDKGGTTTAGESAFCILFFSLLRSAALKLQLPILARFVSFAVAGVDPEVMGVGPAVAIPKALEKAGISMEDVSVFELNEAFASQVVYCVKTLGLPRDKLNPNGGAIALGHPLGCTGARQIATLLPELRRRKGRFGVVSMCIGTGMGAAAVIENLML